LPIFTKSALGIERRRSRKLLLRAITRLQACALELLHKAIMAGCSITAATHFGRRLISYRLRWFAPKEQKGSNMNTKSLIVISGIAAAFLGAIPANSQMMAPPRAVAGEAEMLGLHQLCDRGDRQACVRFGFMLGQAQERHAEWRKMHPEWWGWEHR
jgi:hypothetical protein